MNNQDTQLPTPHPADRGAPPLPEDVQRRYKAAKIAPPILCAVCSLLSIIFQLGFTSLGWLIGLLTGLILFLPCAVAALVFCFAPVAKWRVSRKCHISYPIAILCTLEFMFFIATFITILEMVYMRPDEQTIMYIAIILGVLIAGAEAICFAVQAHLGKKYPQILQKESIELKKLEEKYYFGGNSHVEM